jgi:hypothetical protein
LEKHIEINGKWQIATEGLAHKKGIGYEPKTGLTETLQVVIEDVR